MLRIDKNMFVAVKSIKYKPKHSVIINNGEYTNAY